MPALMAAALIASPPLTSLWRRVVVETAVLQLERPDPGWQEEQRDCAGLVRFAYRTALDRLDPKLVPTLWSGPDGKPIAYSDAETLLAHSFRPLRREVVSIRPEDGDLLAFRHEGGPGGAPVFHLMIYVRAPEGDFVVYHPGERGASVRTGKVRELLEAAPAEWKPIPLNPRFLGVFVHRGLVTHG